MYAYVPQILVVIALLLFFFAAIKRPSPDPLDLGWLGMFFLSLAIFISLASRHMP